MRRRKISKFRVESYGSTYVSINYMASSEKDGSTDLVDALADVKFMLLALLDVLGVR